MKKTAVLLLLLCLAFHDAIAQEVGEKMAEDAIRATDLTIPTSPAFTLLGVNPSKVSKPGFARDLNLDMIVKEDRLVSDLAVEVQPIWLLMYDDVSAAEYRAQSTLQRALSSLSLSLGTADRDTARALAYGLRLTVYRETDPMLDEGYSEAMQKATGFTDQEKADLLRRSALEEDVADIETELSDPSLAAERRRELETQKVAFLAELSALETRVATFDDDTTEQIKAAELDFLEEHWNDTMIDVGFGQVFLYRNAALDSLSFDDDGTGLWVNASHGAGKTWLFSVLARHIDRKSDEDDTLLGGNIRYGGPTASFFVEYLYEEPGSRIKRTVAYGGEYRIDNQKAIEAGIRTEYTSSWDLSNLVPQIKINWSFAKDLFQ